MPIKIRGKRRRPSPKAAPQPTIQQATTKLTGSTPGRFRKYLTDKQGRQWDTNSPDTPEGRLTQFSTDDWFAPSADEKGHVERVTVDFPTTIVSEMSFYSRNIPELKKNVQQFVRVACLELLEVLHKMVPRKDSDMNRIEAQTTVNAKAAILAGYEETFNNAKKEIYKLTGMRAFNEARKLVHDTMRWAQAIPASELRERYLSAITGEFRGLIKQTKSVKTNVAKNKVLKRARRRMSEREWD